MRDRAHGKREKYVYWIWKIARTLLYYKEEEWNLNSQKDKAKTQN
jgi:hypothetical protein